MQIAFLCYEKVFNDNITIFIFVIKMECKKEMQRKSNWNKRLRRDSKCRRQWKQKWTGRRCQWLDDFVR